jgi:hypothetical protein
MRKLLPALAVLIGLLLPATPAHAAFRWGGSGFTTYYHNDLNQSADAETHADSSDDFRLTRGWGRIEDGNCCGGGHPKKVQVDKVVLGTQYGVLTTSGVANSGTTSPPFAQTMTPWVRWRAGCTIRYHVAVYTSVRWSDGSLTHHKLLGSWFDRPGC